MMFELVVAAALSVASGHVDAGKGPRLPEGPGSRTSLPQFLAHKRTPTFARQTRLSCGVCHLGGFPQLSRFGRLFKLNGYTLSDLPAITAPADTLSTNTLRLASIPGLSTTAIASATSIAKALPGTASTRAEFPQQFALLFGGEISPKLGALAELSYSDVSGRISIDNTDVRFASHAKLAGSDLLYGFTLHNNPTVQDVWNTSPAWSYPFVSPLLAPRPAATTMLDGMLAHAVIGLGAYAFYDNVLYAEFTTYTSAPQGPRTLIDSTTPNTIRAVAPYWRVALQNRQGPVTAMVGTFGMAAEFSQPGSAGNWNRYLDVGLDAQVEGAIGPSFLVGRASFTHEDQQLAGLVNVRPAGAQNASNSLNTFKLNGTYGPVGIYSFGASFFATSGTSDSRLYPSADVTGSRTGSPASQGEVAELSVNPWLNARVGLQYVMYQRFNGAATSYDVPLRGRNAADNNALFLYFWFAY